MLAHITASLLLLGGSSKTHGGEFSSLLAQANQELHWMGKICLGLPVNTGS